MLMGPSHGSVCTLSPGHSAARIQFPFLSSLSSFGKASQTCLEVCPLGYSKSRHVDNKNQPLQALPGRLDTQVYHFQATDFILSPQTSTVIS